MVGTEPTPALSLDLNQAQARKSLSKPNVY